MPGVKLTMLNSMGGYDFTEALDCHRKWGINVLDLKDCIFGKALIDLSDDEAEHAARLISQNEMSVYCFSSVLFYDDIELGEDEFAARHLEKIDRLLELAEILNPQVIRLLAARTRKRAEFENILEYVHVGYPWLIPMYRAAVDKIHRKGFKATIENEAHGCIFSKPDEILGFFEALGCRDKASFTYDIQNLWQMGTVPTVESYKALSPISGYFHLKGGQCRDEGRELFWASSLEDASWPVLEISRMAVKDGISPVICLNPSHGNRKEGYDYSNITKKDIDFLRKNIPGVE